MGYSIFIIAKEKSMQGFGENTENIKTCPFWKDKCRPDCMLRMTSAEKVTAQCALAVMANQTILMVEKQKKF